MNIVVVESPTKAKTIRKYLGPDFTILASYGHVRDLSPKEGSVDPDDNFSMRWHVDSRGEKHISDIAKAIKSARHLYLATDPDREGEAISWHITQELDRRRALKGIAVKRIVFHEITREAVERAIAKPRSLDQNLIDAYLARRALDYLVGFTLSPILWRKLPGSRSAGRVQSVCLRLICEREAEIENFKKQEYWSIEADFTTPEGDPFQAKLNALEGKALGKMSLTDETSVRDIAKNLATLDYTVAEVRKEKQKRHPRPPFTTSSLQQEAARKLGFSASQTMRLAQKLFEGVDLGGETVGLISYMRTDSVSLSNDVIDGARRAVQDIFGARYVPDSPRRYKTKAKNAQEAHEAIRPTDPGRYPRNLSRYLGQPEYKLYELIWQRTLSCQMESADIEQTSADITATDAKATFRASGSVVLFDGFLALYQEGQDQRSDDESTSPQLPKLAEKQAATLNKIHPQQHFTQPPPRYGEASLVKKMEDIGIGRPSTYASIIDVLQSRNYVRLEKKRFFPEDRGRLVVAFLENFFSRYVGYDFTAKLEDQLDDISNNRENWRDILHAFWSAFFEAVESAKGLSIRAVIDALNDDLEAHFFPKKDAQDDPRACPACQTGWLSLKLSRMGGFIGCSNYPDCRYTRALVAQQDDSGAPDPMRETEIGQDPKSGLPVSLRKGPYGFYLQLGTAQNGEKPKRCSLPKHISPDSLDLDTAIALLSLPRQVGLHPESGQPITAGIGRYGPYVCHDKKYKSLSDQDDVLTIGINRAVTLLAQSRSGGATGQHLGDHPEDGKPVILKSGRYGPYVSHGRLNASLPQTMNQEDITLDTALGLLAERAKKISSGKTGKKKRGS